MPDAQSGTPSTPTPAERGARRLAIEYLATTEALAGALGHPERTSQAAREATIHYVARRQWTSLGGAAASCVAAILLFSLFASGGLPPLSDPYAHASTWAPGYAVGALRYHLLGALAFLFGYVLLARFWTGWALTAGYFYAALRDPAEYLLREIDQPMLDHARLESGLHYHTQVTLRCLRAVAPRRSTNGRTPRRRRRQLARHRRLVETTLRQAMETFDQDPLDTARTVIRLNLTVADRCAQGRYGALLDSDDLADRGPTLMERASPAFKVAAATATALALAALVNQLDLPETFAPLITTTIVLTVLAVFFGAPTIEAREALRGFTRSGE